MGAGMTSADILSDALRAFGEACGLRDLAFDEEGVAGVEVDNAPVTFFIAETPVPHLLIMTLIARLDPNDTLGPRKLMRANFASWLSGAMTVGLDQDGAVVGAATLPAAAASGETLSDIVHALLSAAGQTRRALLQADVTGPETETLDPATTSMA